MKPSPPSGRRRFLFTCEHISGVGDSGGVRRFGPRPPLFTTFVFLPRGQPGLARIVIVIGYGYLESHWFLYFVK